MNPRLRRVVQAVLYEAIAVGFVGSMLSLFFDQPATSTIALAIFMSAVALAWSYVFNSIFERWEASQKTKGRSVWRRLAHGPGRPQSRDHVRAAARRRKAGPSGGGSHMVSALRAAWWSGWFQ